MADESAKRVDVVLLITTRQTRGKDVEQVLSKCMWSRNEMGTHLERPREVMVAHCLTCPTLVVSEACSDSLRENRLDMMCAWQHLRGSSSPDRDL